NLIIVVSSGSLTSNIYYKNYSSDTWTNGSTLIFNSNTGRMAADLDSNGNLQIAYVETTVALKYVKVTITRNSSNLITGASAGSSLSLDTSLKSTNPTLVIANKTGGSGIEKIALAYSMDDTSAPNHEIRFMQCSVSDDCTSAANWKNASGEINGSSSCNGAVTSGAAGLP